MGMLNRIAKAIPEDDNLDLPAPHFNAGTQPIAPQDPQFHNLVPHARHGREINYTVTHSLSEHESSHLGASARTSIITVIVKCIAIGLGLCIALPFLAFVIAGMSA